MLDVKPDLKPDLRTSLHARLEEVIDELERRFGPGVVYRLSHAQPKLGAPALSTGSLALDLATGIGGVPRGHITTIDGPESSGKTTLSYQILASAQANGGLAAFVDAEQSADPDLMRGCGVNMRALLLAEPRDPVEAVEMATILAYSAALDAVVSPMSHFCRSPSRSLPLRSAQGRLLSEAKGLGQALLPAGEGRGMRASGFLAEAARRLNAAVGGTPTALVVTGQSAFASLGIYLKPVRLIIRPGGDVAGLRVQAEVTKNKLAGAQTKAEIDIFEGVGTHRQSELFDLGRSLGLIEQLPLGFVYGNALLGNGRARAVACLERDSDLASRLDAAIRYLWRTPVASPAVLPACGRSAGPPAAKAAG